MDWKELWTALFGTVDFMGLNMGFWVGMAAVAVIVVAENLVFWLAFKPFKG